MRYPLKKIIIALIALLFSSTSKSAEPKKSHLVLWHAYRAKERLALEKTVDKWNKHKRGKHLPIKLLAIPYDAFADKVNAAIPRGHGPDLFIFAHDRIGDWAEAKIIEPIEFWMTEKHADQFLFKTIEALCYGDSLYGLPLAFKSTILYYNKALIPNPPKTTDDLLALGKKLTSYQDNRYALVYDNTKLYFHALWLFGFSGNLFDKENKLIMSSQGAIDALKFAHRIATENQGIIPKETSSVLTTSLFNQGKAAMAISGPWMLGELKSDLDFGTAILPIVSQTKKRASPFLGAEGIMMSAKSKHKAEAFAAMRYLTSDEAAFIRASLARQPVANHQVWTRKAILSDKILATFRKQIDHATVMPGTPEMRMVWAPYDMALQKVIRNNVAPKQALKEAEIEIKRFLSASKKDKKR